MESVNELNKWLVQHLNWNKARIACLAQILQALICAKTVNLTQIGCFFKSAAKSESTYRRIRRFFASFSFDYTVLIPTFLSVFSLEKDLVLILDRTNWKWGKKNINILLLSAAYKGISVPLYWSGSAQAGNSSTKQRKEILEKIVNILGQNRIRSFLADREFVGEEWFNYLNKQKIPFVIRVKKNTKVGGITPYYQVAIIEIWNRYRKEGPILNHKILLGGLLLYASISQGKGATEPMIVVSDQAFANPIALYQRRWEVETLFSCLKSRGFNFEDTHMTDPKRIERLLFVLAIAFVWTYKVGVTKAEEQPVVKKAHGRSAKSLFRVGLDWLCSILLNLYSKLEDFQLAVSLLSYSRIRS